MKEKNTKQKILDALEDYKERKLRCPFCGGDRFIRTEVAFCDIVDDGESITDEEISGVEYTFVCKNCKKDVTEEELK